MDYFLEFSVASCSKMWLYFLTATSLLLALSATDNSELSSNTRFKREPQPFLPLNCCSGLLEGFRKFFPLSGSFEKKFSFSLNSGNLNHNTDSGEDSTGTEEDNQ